MHYIRSTLANVLLSVLAIFLFLLIAEFIIRLPKNKDLKTNAPSWINLSRKNLWNCFELNSKVIYTNTKNITKVADCYSTNEQGFRNTSDIKNSSAKNIVFLGDSFTWGHGVEKEETYPSHFQKIVNEKGSDVKAINAGLPGYGTDQQLIYFEEIILSKIKPHIVVWNINENDWINNNQTCLFSVKNNKLIKQSARKNTLYLLIWIYQHTPSSILDSKLYWFLFNKIPNRYTFGCTKNFQDTDETPIHLNTELIKHINKKLTLQLIRMKNLENKYGFKLLLTFVEGQSAYEIPEDTKYKFINKLKLIPLIQSRIDMIIISDAIKANIHTALNQKEEAHNQHLVLGVTTQNLDSKLFLEDTDFPYGSKHMNALGNQLFAESVFEKIKENL